MSMKLGFKKAMGYPIDPAERAQSQAAKQFDQRFTKGMNPVERFQNRKYIKNARQQSVAKNWSKFL